MAKFITHDEETGQVIEQGKQAWKELRAGNLTGTSVEDILPGVRGGYKDSRALAIHRIVAEILTGQPAPGSFGGNAATRAGHDKEPYARIAYEALTGYVVEEVAFVKHDWLRVGTSPDGVMRDIRRGVEIKSPYPATHLAYMLGSVCPQEYRHQVQLNLWVTGYDAWDFVSYCPEMPEGLQLWVLECLPDRELHAMYEKEIANAHAEVNLLLKRVRGLAAA